MGKTTSKTLLALALIGALVMITQQWIARQRLSEELSNRDKEYQQVKALLAERDERLSNYLTQSTEMERLRKDQLELLRLRGEVGRLRAESKRLSDLSNRQATVQRQQVAAPQSNADGAAVYLPRDSWADVGMATPEATLQTTSWAAREANTPRALDAFAPEFRSEFEKAIAQDPSSTNPPGGFWPNVTGIQILEKRVIDAEQVELVYQMEESGTKRPAERQLLKRFGTEWRFAGPPRALETK